MVVRLITASDDLLPIGSGEPFCMRWRKWLKRFGDAAATWARSETPARSAWWDKLRVTAEVCNLLHVCAWLQVCRWLALCVCIFLCARLYVCASDVQLHRDKFQMMENVSATVFRIILLGIGHIFCFESYSTINIKLTWMWNSGKHCKSTQSQPPIHGQWSSSKLYISMSSQIRVSALWFFGLCWRIVHDYTVEDFSHYNFRVLLNICT